MSRMAQEGLVLRRTSADRTLLQPVPDEYRHTEILSGLDLQPRLQLHVQQVVEASLHPVAVRPKHYRLRTTPEQQSSESDVALPHRQVSRLGSSRPRHDDHPRSRQ